LPDVARNRPDPKAVSGTDPVPGRLSPRLHPSAVGTAPTNHPYRLSCNHPSVRATGPV